MWARKRFVAACGKEVANQAHPRSQKKGRGTATCRGVRSQETKGNAALEDGPGGLICFWNGEITGPTTHMLAAALALP
jgi:hypothetical protein